MTNKEIQTQLKGVTNKDWFKSIQVIFNFSKVNVQDNKIGFFSIYQYVNNQVRGWQKLSDDLPSDFIHSRRGWNDLLQSLNIFISNQKDQVQSNTLTSNWNNINNKVDNINSQCFPIDCPETSFLFEVYKLGTNHYSGAQKYLINNSSLNFSNKEEFAGAIMAYEYSFKDDSLIPKRRNSEKSSIAQIRNSFEKELSNSQHSVNDFLKTSEENWKNITKHISDKAKSQNNTVNGLIQEKQDAYEKWLIECKQNDQDYTKYQLQRVKDLEELYQEKLKLEAPAQYWRLRAERLEQEGRRWLIGLILASVVSIISLAVVLFFISDGTLKDLFSKTGSAIRWSIVFVTFVSFLAYAIRIFAKLTFSAYHLFRDAEEREQLAYVYLALKKEQNIDDTERHLVMQSLFSRADSGLLKDDSSPTMPGGSIIEKLMGGK